MASLQQRLPSGGVAGLTRRSCRLPARIPAFTSCTQRAQQQRKQQHICRAQDVDIDSAVDAFMKRQAELESGAAFARTVDRGTVIGSDVVTDEMARTYCREIFEILKTLKQTRDMSVNEVKLVVGIEDPRTKERRMQGIEDDRGVSRDEMTVALLEVAEGKVPKDRIALKCLYEEISNWPFLEVSPQGAGGEPKEAPKASDYQALQGGDTIAKPYMLGKEARAGDKPESLADMLPAWAGYVTLYGISAIPVLIVIATVSVLFWSSLK